MEILKKISKYIRQNISEKKLDRFIGNIGAVKVEGLRPIKSRAFGKSGNLSLAGKIGQHQVKLSSMFEEDQVGLRLRLSKMSDSIYLPNVLASEGRLIIEEWIDGCPPGIADRQRIRQVIFEYLSCEERFAFSSDDLNDFEYLDYLEHRVLEWSFLQGLPEFLDRWRKQRAALANQIRPALCNPDLSYENFVIETATKRIFMIDTEFFHVGEGWFMDHFNSAVRNEPITVKVSPEVLCFARNCVKLRKVGSALIVGRPDRVTSEMLEFEDG